jgi:hypothetical protein
MVASVDPSVMLEMVKVFPATERVGLKVHVVGVIHPH